MLHESCPSWPQTKLATTELTKLENVHFGHWQPLRPD